MDCKYPGCGRGEGGAKQQNISHTPNVKPSTLTHTVFLQASHMIGTRGSIPSNFVQVLPQYGAATITCSSHINSMEVTPHSSSGAALNVRFTKEGGDKESQGERPRRKDETLYGSETLLNKQSLITNVSRFRVSRLGVLRPGQDHRSGQPIHQGAEQDVPRGRAAFRRLRRQ